MSNAFNNFLDFLETCLFLVIKLLSKLEKLHVLNIIFFILISILFVLLVFLKPSEKPSKFAYLFSIILFLILLIKAYHQGIDVVDNDYDFMCEGNIDQRLFFKFEFRNKITLMLTFVFHYFMLIVRVVLNLIMTFFVFFLIYIFLFVLRNEPLPPKRTYPFPFNVINIFRFIASIVDKVVRYNNNINEFVYLMPPALLKFAYLNKTQHIHIHSTIFGTGFLLSLVFGVLFMPLHSIKEMCKEEDKQTLTKESFKYGLFLITSCLICMYTIYTLVFLFKTN